MSQRHGERLAVVAGLAIAAAVALWWLGSTRLALNQGADTGRASGQALQALWAVRAVVLALLGLRVATLRGWRAGAGTAVGLVAPAWPLVVLAASASTWPWSQLLLMECTLLLAGVVTVGLGHLLRRVCSQATSEVAAELAATVLGAASALGLWWLQDLLTLPVP